MIYWRISNLQTQFGNHQFGGNYPGYIYILYLPADPGSTKNVGFCKASKLPRRVLRASEDPRYRTGPLGEKKKKRCLIRWKHQTKPDVGELFF